MSAVQATSSEESAVQEKALRIEGLSKYFGGVRVLEDVSFETAVGERLAIIGPNGAGKTTLLNLINGQLEPTRGKILYFGRDITALPTHTRAQSGQSRSFQIPSLLKELTVLENTMLVMHGLRKSRLSMFRRSNGYEDVVSNAREALEDFALWDKRDETVGRLSYGDQRRLEIDLCMATHPRMLLLDEPTNGLTREEGALIIEMINERVGDDVTVLIVAHDMHLIFSVADRVLVLHDGKILICDECDVVRCDDRVREIYMGG